jgi:hypothetical protein
VVEQCPFKAWVAGSNPAALTKNPLYSRTFRVIFFSTLRAPKRRCCPILCLPGIATVFAGSPVSAIASSVGIIELKVKRSVRFPYFFLSEDEIQCYTRNRHGQRLQNDAVFLKFVDRNALVRS